MLIAPLFFTVKVEVSLKFLYLMTQSSSLYLWIHSLIGVSGESGGSVVERPNPEQEVGGSKPTPAVLCP